MAAVINTNISSLNAQRNLNTSQSQLATSLQRLSSGLRINSAKDDAAGLAISERFSTQIRGMNVAARNANDGISLAQSAEGAMTEISNNLQRIRELAVQSRNATNSTSDRAALNAEAQQLKAEVDRVATTTAFNGTKLLDGNFTNQAFQVGANQGETISIAGIVNAQSTALGSWNSVPTAAVATAAAVSADVPGTPANWEITVAGANIDIGAGAVDATAALQAALSTTNTTEAAAEDDFMTKLASYIDAGALTATYDDTTGTLSVNNTSGGDLALDLSALGLGVGSATVTNGGAAVTFNVSALTQTAVEDPAVSASFTAIGAGELTINSVGITVGTATTAGGRVDDLVIAINASSAGVTALNVGGVLRLTAADATSDIVVAGSAALAKSGLTVETTGPTAGTAQTGFATLDISSAAGADSAILAMDGALTALNSARADMGAVQNRFSSVVASLQTTSENLSASRSRILDTDFAAETANLTRGQILQQAGTAMLAQANSLPNGVLALLRG